MVMCTITHCQFIVLDTNDVLYRIIDIGLLVACLPVFFFTHSEEDFPVNTNMPLEHISKQCLVQE